MKVAAIAVALLMAGSAVHSQTQKEKTMKVTRITPVLFAANIEPCVKFWTERLGFQKVAEVPEGNTMGFAMLDKDGVELMYQSYASADKDNASTGPLVRKGPSFLYVEVSDLDSIARAVSGAEVAIPLRTTFYGMKEFWGKGSGGARDYVRAENGDGNETVTSRAYCCARGVVFG